MVLYVDETENDEYFIVAGILAKSDLEVETAYKQFKRGIKNIRIPEKYRGKVYTEFKSTLLDHDYKKVKLKMLECIVDLNPDIIYSVHRKKFPIMNQAQKEIVYITLLSAILASLKIETTVIFDRFGKPDFEKNIMSCVNVNPNVIGIYPWDSQKQHGLQFADNVCSVIRRHKSKDDEFDYYDEIEKFVKEV